MHERFRDRADAGRRLALELADLAGEDVLVVGLPRGGVPVAAEVAHALRAPLDVILVRKLGAPFNPEVAMGAIGEDGVEVVNDDVVGALRVTAPQWESARARERSVLAQRAAAIRPTAPALAFRGRIVVVVDDGVATGSTARAACEVARAKGARLVLLATPVIAPSAIPRLQGVADRVVFVDAPVGFRAVGQFYRDFEPTSDEQVLRVLDAARSQGTHPCGSD